LAFGFSIGFSGVVVRWRFKLSVTKFALPVVAIGCVLLYATRSESQNQAGHSALPLTMTAPADNPQSADKVALGRLLFWDPILSGQKDVACATCHHPRLGYADARDVSVGVNGIGMGARRRFAAPNSVPFVKRNSQTVLNVAFNGMDEAGRYEPSTAPMFWDLRSKGLEAQALEPIKNFEEMRGDAYPEEKAVDEVVARLNAVPEYRALFAKAFGTEIVTGANLGKALASFQRSLLANNSPFDRYMRGDRNAMTPAQIDGMRRFQSVGCGNCHSGPMFSDFKPHVLGVPDSARRAESDPGIIGSPYAFRTASLRNLNFTAPYMHSGAFETLAEVMEFYDDAPENPHVGRRQVDRLVRQLDDPDDEARALIAFLGALNDDSFDKTIPARVPSGLAPGGRIQ
jgi:cytochrome c peroxidase